jgi:hypothetical protein
MVGDIVIARATGDQGVDAPLVLDDAQPQRSCDAHRTESCWRIYKPPMPGHPPGRADPSSPGWGQSGPAQ